MLGENSLARPALYTNLIETRKVHVPACVVCVCVTGPSSSSRNVNQFPVSSPIQSMAPLPFILPPSTCLLPATDCVVYASVSRNHSYFL